LGSSERVSRYGLQLSWLKVPTLLSDPSNGISHVLVRDEHNRISMSIYAHSVRMAGLVDMASIL
jgi:hypothetical protein